MGLKMVLKSGAIRDGLGILVFLKKNTVSSSSFVKQPNSGSIIGKCKSKSKVYH